jgi:hypothetical protein
MIKEAIQALGSPTTNVAVRNWILRKYPGTNRSTIQTQIIYCTVNHPSRVHAPDLRKPMTANRESDCLFRTGRGQLELYDPAKHGTWAIVETEDGRLAVQELGEDGQPAAGRAEEPPPAGTAAFAMETHLRDYLAANLHKIEDGLSLYVDDDGNVGVEYPTPVGRIDILATDRNGDFLVVELKASRGADAACGQLLRYKGWVRQYLAHGKKARGVIIANRITDRIRYAIREVSDVGLMEYTLDVTLRQVDPNAGGS